MTDAVPADADVPLPHTASQVRDRLLRGLRIAILIVAITVQFGLCVPQLLANREHGGPWWPELAAFVVFTTVAVLVVVAVIRRSRSDALALTLTLACLLAAVLASIPVPVSMLLAADDWSFGLVGWYGLTLLFDRRLPVLCAFFAAHLLLSAAEVLVKGVPASNVTAAMGIAAVSVCGFQLAVGLAAQLFRRTAFAAGEAAEREERARTEKAIAEHTHRDHEQRYARLLDTTVPLLTGLAYGTLDPEHPETRRRSAVEAARLRQLFAEADDVSDHLVHELRAGIDLAERRGVSVQLSVRGEVRPVPREARHELVAAASVILASALSYARATVVRTGSAVRVSVVADVPEEMSGDTVSEPPEHLGAPGQVETTATERNGKLWLEARWPPTR